MAIKALIKKLAIQRQLNSGRTIVATFICKCKQEHFHTRLIKKETLRKHRFLINEESGILVKEGELK